MFVADGTDEGRREGIPLRKEDGIADLDGPFDDARMKD